MSLYLLRACPDGTPLPLKGGEWLPPEKSQVVPYPQREYSRGEPLPPESMSGWRSPPLKGRGRGGVCNFFSESFIVCSSPWKKLETPPLPRLRPTVASLPNCSGPRRFAPQSLPPRDCLAIALKGGEWLPPEKSQVVPIPFKVEFKLVSCYLLRACPHGTPLFKPSPYVEVSSYRACPDGAPLPSRGGVGVGSVTSSAYLLSSVLLVGKS